MGCSAGIHPGAFIVAKMPNPLEIGTGYSPRLSETLRPLALGA